MSSQLQFQTWMGLFQLRSMSSQLQMDIFQALLSVINVFLAINEYLSNFNGVHSSIINALSASNRYLSNPGGTHTSVFNTLSASNGYLSN